MQAFITTMKIAINAQVQKLVAGQFQLKLHLGTMASAPAVGNSLPEQGIHTSPRVVWNSDCLSDLTGWHTIDKSANCVKSTDKNLPCVMQNRPILPADKIGRYYHPVYSEIIC